MMSDGYSSVIKKSLIILTILCVLPAVFNLLGWDFGSNQYPLATDEINNMSSSELTNHMFHGLRGAFHHTLLEWSALWAAAFTAFLALSHFRIVKDITTPIIGVALFFSGCMDAFHTLAADRLIEAVADNKDLIPFTWAICRLFNSLIMIIGVGFFAYGKPLKLKGSMLSIMAISLAFGLISYAIIHYCATSANLPQTMYVDGFFGYQLITRPFDVLPLLVYIIAGIWVYPKFYRRYPNLFSVALIASLVPEIATQIYMAFGSTRLFDNAFNIAHFLKIFAYLVPFSGLMMDYIATYQNERSARQQAEKYGEISKLARQEAEAHAVELISANKQLAIATQSAEQAKIIAESANLAKSDFLNLISHELRTPLTVVLGNLQELSDKKMLSQMLPIHFDEQRLQHYFQLHTDVSHSLKPTTEEPNLAQYCYQAASVSTFEVMEIASDAHKDALHLLSLINDVLDFSKIEAGKMTIMAEPTNAMVIVDQVVTSMARLADEKEISLVTDIPASLVVSAEAIRFKQILINLLGNAIKFTERGEISIKAHRDDLQAIFTITDTGCGIEQSQLNSIFEAFKQVDSSSTRAASGTGLGLPITKKLVELHHGQIWVESAKEKGSQFSFSLPLANICELTG